ncbi:MAG: polyamine ABC transporter substrate-binding protein, partial [Candidatus Nanopelagicales bacterium]
MATVRKFKFSATVVAAAALVLAACSSGSSDEASSASVDPNVDITTQKLVISNWAGYYPEDLAAKVKEAIGVDITITNHATNEEVMGKLTASDDSGIDVAFVSGQYAQALASAGKIVNFDKAAIPNLANLYPEVADLAYDKGTNYSAPYAWGTTGICYRSDLIDFTPSSWNDLLNPKDSVKGKTTMLATERWLALPAMKALGYSVNTTNADEIAKAKEQLIATKPTLLAYDDTAFYTKLVSGEAVLTEAWDGW